MHFSARGVAWRVNTAIHLGKNELLGERENFNTKSERLAAWLGLHYIGCLVLLIQRTTATHLEIRSFCSIRIMAEVR